jgi:hypothetical protein
VTAALAELALELELSSWAPWRLLERGTEWILAPKSDLLELLSGVRRLPLKESKILSEVQRSIRPSSWSSSGTAKKEGFQVKGGGDTRAGGLFHPGRSFEPGLDLLRPVQGVEFLAADAIGFAGAGLAAMLLNSCRRARVLFDLCRHRDRLNILQVAEARRAGTNPETGRWHDSKRFAYSCCGWER